MRHARFPPLPDIPNLAGEIFDGPVGSGGLQAVGGGAVLPDGVADGLARVGLQGGLGEQTGDEAGQQIAAAALRQPGIAGGVQENVAFAAADQGLVAFQHHPAAAVTTGDFAERTGAVGLDGLGAAAQEAGGFAGMRGEDAAAAAGAGAGASGREWQVNARGIPTRSGGRPVATGSLLPLLSAGDFGALGRGGAGSRQAAPKAGRFVNERPELPPD